VSRHIGDRGTRRGELRRSRWNSSAQSQSLRRDGEQVAVAVLGKSLSLRTYLRFRWTRS